MPAKKMTEPTVDFQALLTKYPPPGLLGRLSRKLNKIRAVKNWRRFDGKFTTLVRPDSGLCKVEFRNGLELLVRPGTHDLYIVYEVYLEGGYRYLEEILRRYTEPVTVIDLGAHIGCFTLKALSVGPNVSVESYEPSADNRSVLLENLALHPFTKGRARVYDVAVGASDGVAQFFHNPTVTTDSSLYGAGEGQEITVVSVKTIVSRIRTPIACLKIDVEGAEYELVNGSEPELWASIPVIMAEVHDDPSGRSNGAAWLQKMYDLGYTKQRRDLNGVVLERA